MSLLIHRILNAHPSGVPFTFTLSLPRSFICPTFSPLNVTYLIFNACFLNFLLSETFSSIRFYLTVFFLFFFQASINFSYLIFFFICHQCWLNANRKRTTSKTAKSQTMIAFCVMFCMGSQQLENSAPYCRKMLFISLPPPCYRTEHIHSMRVFTYGHTHCLKCGTRTVFASGSRLALSPSANKHAISCWANVKRNIVASSSRNKSSFFLRGFKSHA